MMNNTILNQYRHIIDSINKIGGLIKVAEFIGQSSGISTFLLLTRRSLFEKMNKSVIYLSLHFSIFFSVQQIYDRYLNKGSYYSRNQTQIYFYFLNSGTIRRVEDPYLYCLLN